MAKNTLKKSDVFISYGRAHSKGFATKLHTILLEQGFDVWFDQNDIPLGIDFQDQIYEGIEKADNFCYIISPHAVKSEYCLKELVHAIKYNKRIIPLLHVEPADCWDKMHPVIEKLNWIYCQEDKDDLEKAFSGIIGLLKLHTDYIKKHTSYLISALQWEYNQKDDSYLLTENSDAEHEHLSLSDAKQWLLKDFDNALPPCLPADIHCEYISASIKQQEKGLTDTFLCYSTEDLEGVNKIRMSLMRKGITTWLNTSDIKIGTEFNIAIQRGLQSADTILFFLSPEAVVSEYCLRELNWAKQYNKRIVPLLLKETANDKIPADIVNLQYTNFFVQMDHSNSMIQHSHLNDQLIL